jgi:hypothetical protein
VARNSGAFKNKRARTEVHAPETTLRKNVQAYCSGLLPEVAAAAVL